jgi:hypothetical protein
MHVCAELECPSTARSLNTQYCAHLDRLFDGVLYRETSYTERHSYIQRCLIQRGIFYREVSLQRGVLYREASFTERHPLQRGIHYREASFTERHPLQRGVLYREVSFTGVLYKEASITETEEASFTDRYPLLYRPYTEQRGVLCRENSYSSCLMAFTCTHA